MEQKVGWWRSAAYWLAGYAMTGAVLVLAAVAALETHVWPSAFPAADAAGVPRQIHEAATFSTAIFDIILAAFAFIAPLPIQATSLYLRRAKTGAEMFAGVAALNITSTLISAFIYGSIERGIFFSSASFEYTATLLVGFYCIHIVILLVSRLLIGKRGDVAEVY